MVADVLSRRAFTKHPWTLTDGPLSISSIPEILSFTNTLLALHLETSLTGKTQFICRRAFPATSSTKARYTTTTGSTFLAPSEKPQLAKQMTSTNPQWLGKNPVSTTNTTFTDLGSTRMSNASSIARDRQDAQPPHPRSTMTQGGRGRGCAGAWREPCDLSKKIQHQYHAPYGLYLLPTLLECWGKFSVNLIGPLIFSDCYYQINVLVNSFSPIVEYGINDDTKSSTTGYTPFFLEIGRHAMPLLDINLPPRAAPSLKHWQSVLEVVKDNIPERNADHNTLTFEAKSKFIAALAALASANNV
ncbi:hypothetical protein HDU67_002098 [Dinochytrium kinnereticum]|nr:hypothetical protein HDU67_002098 [Dinochytrium kinnereticum]